MPRRLEHAEPVDRQRLRALGLDSPRDYLAYLRATMGRAVKDFQPFEEAYAKTDWSRYATLPAFAEANRVDHLLIGARQHSLMRHLLGSVSAKVAAEAECSVTVVRPSRTTESGGSQ